MAWISQWLEAEGRAIRAPIALFLQKSAGCLSPNATSSPIAHRQLSKLAIVFTVEEKIDRGCTAPIPQFQRRASPDQPLGGALDPVEARVMKCCPPQVIHRIQLDVGM